MVGVVSALETLDKSITGTGGLGIATCLQHLSVPIPENPDTKMRSDNAADKETPLYRLVYTKIMRLIEDMHQMQLAGEPASRIAVAVLRVSPIVIKRLGTETTITVVPTSVSAVAIRLPTEVASVTLRTFSTRNEAPGFASP